MSSDPTAPAARLSRDTVTLATGQLSELIRSLAEPLRLTIREPHRLCARL